MRNFILVVLFMLSFFILKYFNVNEWWNLIPATGILTIFTIMTVKWMKRI